MIEVKRQKEVETRYLRCFISDSMRLLHVAEEEAMRKDPY